MVLFAAIVSLIHGCTCADEDLYTTASPSKKRTVVVSRRNCGATSGFTTVISERRSRLQSNVELLELDGEALGEKELRIGWVGDDEIVVGTDPKFTIHPLDLSATDLSVGYEPGTRLGAEFFPKR